MTSRRTLTHSYSANGRYGSQNGDDVPSPRLDGRNYLSSVRPENRSTFCTVMSQLTEETQPCFETTIKSKAVSETSNVKFTCEVTGHPLPELTWYKDDMELDRYCGLPKYEIFRSGKTHTLHIYNCTVDDAAIYQASARNSKGIVSCSGVLEVGAMSEYKIHQRFFAKLKQKAELKRRELEQSYCKEKETILQEQLISSQNNIRWNDGLLRSSPSVQVKEDNKENEGEIMEDQLEALDPQLSRLSMNVHRYQMESDQNQEPDSQHTRADVAQKDGNQQIMNISEKAEINDTTQSVKEKVSEKNIMVSNGFDEAFTTKSMQDTREGKETHEEMNLAKLLVESFQLKFGEDQKTSFQSQEITSSKVTPTQEKESMKEMDTKGEVMEADGRHQEYESNWDGGQEQSLEKEQKTTRLPKPEHKPAAPSETKAAINKEPEYQHKSALSSVSSMLHSIKDIIFGKNKKSPEYTDSSKKFGEINLENEIPADNTEAQHHLPQKEPQRHDTKSGVCSKTPNELILVSVDQQNQVGTLHENTHIFQEKPSLHIQTETKSSNLDNNILPLTTNYTKDISQASEIHCENVEGEKEDGPNALQKTVTLTTKASDDHTESNINEHVVQKCHETAEQEYTTPSDQNKQGGREEVEVVHAVEEQDNAPDFTVPSKASIQPNRTDLESRMSTPAAQISMPVSQETLLVPNTCMHKDIIMADEGIVKYNLINESTDKKDVIMEESTDSTKKSETFTDHITEGTPICERIQNGNVITHDRSASALEISHGESNIMETNFTRNLNSVLGLNDENTQRNENVQEVAEGPVGHDTTNVETINIIYNKENNLKTNEVSSMNSLEKVKDKHGEGTQKKMNIETEQKNDSKGEIANFISEEATEISKNKKHLEIEGEETHLRLKEKTNVCTQVQPERPMVESRGQSGVASIVILPDTKETVKKNVTKKRTVPFTPEIKVTVPEKLKHEELFSLPRTDVLLPEPEKIIQPLVHEIAHSDNEPSSDKPGDIATKGTNINARDDRVVITAQTVDAPQYGQDVNQSEKTTTNFQLEHLEVQMGVREEPSRASSDLGKATYSRGIPIISIACADDISVHPDSAALTMETRSSSFIPTTRVESTTENSIKKENVPESLTVIPKEVVSHFDSDASHNLNQVAEKPAYHNEGTERKNLVETQLSSDVSSELTTKAHQNTTTYDSDICLDKELKMEPDADRLQKDKCTMEKLCLTTPVGPTLPPLSPASLRRLMAKNNPNLESQVSTVSMLGDGSEKKGEDSGGSTPTSTLSCEGSPKMKRRDSLTLIPSATPEELASGARRKIYLAKTKSEDEGSDTQIKRESPYLSPSQARRAALLQLQSGQQAQQLEKHSPLLGRRKTMGEVQKPKEEPSEESNTSNAESKSVEKEKQDPYKAPRVIRKIRGEPYSDALGNLKLWCQFFNVLSDSTIKWFKDDVEIAEINKSAGDETQVALAIVQASSRDCGVYSCTIKNEYGTDTTDYLLSSSILADFFLRDDSEVGEEIEMTPLLFPKGLVDPGYWGNKFFGRIMMEELQIGEGSTYKKSRAKVIYGLDPVFDSGSTCIVKVRNQIVYGTKEENCLAEINLQITKQKCKVHNTIREYCKIFAAEARAKDKFGLALEVIPSYLIYRPANTIPYATVETDLKGVYSKYCTMDNAGRLIMQTTSEFNQKCCTFQHWLYQWTSGNLLVTQLEGVNTKITNVKIATKSKGYQSLTDKGSPKILEQFVIQHQCNYYCGLLELRVLTTMDTLQQPKLKTSRSPMFSRKVGPTDSSSPQLLKKGSSSPQPTKKVNSSPKVAKKD